MNKPSEKAAKLSRDAESNREAAAALERERSAWTRERAQEQERLLETEREKKRWLEEEETPMRRKS